MNRKFNFSIALLVFLLLPAGLLAQTTGYSWTTDVSYQSQITPSTAYSLEKKVFDIGHVEMSPQGLPVIVWFHGGGLTSGDNTIPEGLKRAGYIIASADYRQAPAVPATTIIDDAVEAIAWVIENIEDYGGDPEKIFIAGHSAGGYLAMMAVLDSNRLQDYGIDAGKIAGVIPMSGHTITHFQIRKERGIPQERAVVDEYAPLHFVKANTPPILLITGDRDKELLGRYEENAYFQRMMQVAGNTSIELLELQGYGHLMAQPAFPLLFDFVDRVLENSN